MFSREVIFPDVVCASVAQLDRASVFGTEGLRFESSRVHFFFRGHSPKTEFQSRGLGCQ